LINDDNGRLEFLNSWGPKFADNGFFCVKDENVLENLKLYDVYAWPSKFDKDGVKLFKKYKGVNNKSGARITKMDDGDEDYLLEGTEEEMEIFKI
jgi:hypothetical protein